MDRKPPPFRELPEWLRAPERPAPHRRRSARNALIAVAAWTVLAVVIAITYWLSALPDTTNLLSYEPKKDITLFDANGRLIARRGLTRGDSIAVGELPAYVGDAFIAIEDRRFRSHFGVDPWGLSRALYTDVTEGGYVQGGSTITQQLAKNLFLQPDRTVSRKIEEALLALRLEFRFSKDQILTLYLNRVYFGGGVYGIEAASQRFFSKLARELTLTEAAMLAGSVKAPSRYNPATDKAAAMGRAVVVLKAMQDAGFIDEAQRKQAIAAPPRIARNLATPGAGYFVDYAISLVPALVGKKMDSLNERLIVDTTLDLDMQAKAERALEAGLDREGKALRASQGALVAMTTEGALRAIVGGKSYDDSTFDRATEALRQPGSAFKAFVYLAALEHGRTPADKVFDGPVTIGRWAPDNYEGKYEGDITLAHALAHSSNSAAVQLTNEVGPAEVARVAHRLGVTATLHEVPSLALGTSELTPLELVRGYAAFASGGSSVRSYGIIRIRTASGKLLYQHKSADAARVMSPENNVEMTDMMAGTVIDGTGTAARLGDRPVAGKTGTSQDYRDAWFVGFTADYVCGVWIGNDDNAPMRRATGGGLPARIFKTFMTDAERGLPPQPLAGTQIALDIQNTKSEDAPAPHTANEPTPAQKNDNDLLAAFQNLLDKLF